MKLMSNKSHSEASLGLAVCKILPEIDRGRGDARPFFRCYHESNRRIFCLVGEHKTSISQRNICQKIFWTIMFGDRHV